MKILVSTICAAAFLAGCATADAPEEYARAMAARPVPTTKESVQKECDFLIQERARLQNLYNQGPLFVQSGLIKAAIRSRAQQDMAAVEMRSQRIDCYAAFHQGGPMSLDDCMAQCAEKTSQTKDSCFNTCSIGR